jgi:LuxR family transcriptional regulator, maltose regulon positive regulatory protein
MDQEIATGGDSRAPGGGMSGSDDHDEVGLMFDLLASKLRRPLVRPGTILRSPLIGQLARDDPRPVVTVVAPPGYGKTTLLAQWAELDGRSVAWVSVDEQDNDPKVLLRYVAEALDAVQPVGPRVFKALGSPTSSVPGSVVPRLASAFSSMTVPLALVLDDVHLLRATECRHAVSVLAEHVPAGSRMVLAGRSEPPVRAARLRAQGRLAEIGLSDLVLTREEAAALLRAAKVTLGEDEVAALHERTEGWPVGLYLAALYLREGGPVGSAAVSFGGDDRLVSEYMEAEFLTRISSRHRAFLTRTAVLDRMSGRLCAAVLDEPGGTATLAELARSNLLLVPLDRRGTWYRYHRLFRDMLLAELERVEPSLLPVLRRRAASWCLANDLAEEALEYSLAAGDVDTVARLAGELWLPVFQQGRITTVERWFQWLYARGGTDAHPAVAARAGTVLAATGRPAEAERWADAVDRWRSRNGERSSDPATEAWAALLRATMCRHGISQMRADADEAVLKAAAANITTPGPALCQGIARALSGDLDGGDAWLEEAARVASQCGSVQFQAEALSERSLLMTARGNWSRAEVLADQADTATRRAGIEVLIACAAQARVAMHQGDTVAVRRQLVSAQRLRPTATYAQPHIAVQARIELIRVHLALADMAGARTLMEEIDEILRIRPDLGTLVGQARELRARLARERGSNEAGVSSLTAAELRLLPLLATHMSYPEIAAELFVSGNTIKSQAYSLFRKLGVSTRSQAVARARELALLEGPVRDTAAAPAPGEAAPAADGRVGGGPVGLTPAEGCTAPPASPA